MRPRYASGDIFISSADGDGFIDDVLSETDTPLYGDTQDLSGASE